MKAVAAVVIPYYHSKLTESEKISFQNCLKVLGNHPVVLVVPEGMPVEEYPSYKGLIFQCVPDKWMESAASYNQMMLLEEFYSRFIQYEYILIFQLDAFVFSDSLEQFCNYGYDYIGAPWLKGWPCLRDLERGVWHVGNGGFSLRRVSAFLNILKDKQIDTGKAHEDLFWASRDSEKFRVAPMDVALAFAFEQDVRQCFEMNQKKLPFGCHAWEKYDFEFWKPVFEKMGYTLSIEPVQGVDRKNNYLRPCPHYLEAGEEIIKLCLGEVSEKRKNGISIFGCGDKGRECGWLLRHIGLPNVRYIDNNPEKWGKRLWDIVIESPDRLKQADHKDNFIIIAVNTLKNENDIRNQLKMWGYDSEECMIIYDELTERITSILEERNGLKSEKVR